MQASESSMPSSMLTSMMLAPPRTWSIATAAAPAQSLALTSRSNFFEPVTLVRSPIIWKLRVRPDDQRLESGEARQPAPLILDAPIASCLSARGRSPSTACSDRADVIRRRAAAAADDVDEAAFGELVDQRRGLRRAVSSYSPKAFGSPALG